jgi:hypothetical protein
LDKNYLLVIDKDTVFDQINDLTSETTIISELQETGTLTKISHFTFHTLNFFAPGQTSCQTTSQSELVCVKLTSACVESQKKSHSYFDHGFCLFRRMISEFS